MKEEIEVTLESGKTPVLTRKDHIDNLKLEYLLNKEEIDLKGVITAIEYSTGKEFSEVWAGFKSPLFAARRERGLRYILKNNRCDDLEVIFELLTLWFDHFKSENLWCTLPHTDDPKRMVHDSPVSKAPSFIGKIKSYFKLKKTGDE